MRVAPGLAGIVMLLGAGCGASSSTRSTSSSSPAPASASAADAASLSTSASASGTASATTSAPASGTASAATTGAASTTSTGSATSGSKADTDVRLPAKFTILAGGRLRPSFIAVPRHTAVALTLTAGDGRGHTVVLALPHRRTVRLRAGRTVRLLLTGLADGSYELEADGRPRGRLIVGANPGP